MVEHMKSVAQQPQELNVEERNLLSVAYKNVIGSRRASWRVIASIEQKGDPDKLALIQNYKRKIESELENICSDILEIIKNELIPNSESEEGKVFYYKMKVILNHLYFKKINHRVIIIDIWLNSNQEIQEKNQHPKHLRHIQLLLKLQIKISHQLTQFDWDWH